MKHGNHGLCILSNLLEASHNYVFYFNTMHKFMSNFEYKHKIKKLSYTKVHLGLHFLVINEILNFINNEVQYKLTINKY